MIEIYQNGFQGCALNYKENSEPNVTRIERSGIMNTNFSRRFLGCEPYFLTWLSKYLSIVHSKDLQAFTTSKFFFLLSLAQRIQISRQDRSPQKFISSRLDDVLILPEEITYRTIFLQQAGSLSSSYLTRVPQTDGNHYFKSSV